MGCHSALILAAMAASSARAASPKWWTNIGAPKFVAAPMVDQSGLAFRLLARKYGAELAFTPMIHAGVSQCPQRGRGYLARHFQTGDGDWPLVAQFAGADEDEVSRSVARVLERDPTNNVVALDLNLGCPQQIARKGRYGAFLLEDDVDAAAKVVARLRKDYCDGTGRVVTCKVRLMPDDGPALRGTKERVARLVDAGASAITVHGRTRLQNKQHSGACDWSAIATLRASLPADVVAIANGGIGCRGDVDRVLDATGCDAAMSSEGLLENPALFAANVDPDDGSHVGQRRLAREYLALAAATGAHVNDARAHVFKFAHGGLNAFPEVRAALAAAEDLAGVAAVVDELDARDPNGDRECRHHAPGFDAAASWYWRHRAAVAAPRDPGVVEARRLRKLRKAQAKARSRTAKAR